jgi:DNA-binding NarL/FixJ family response regulator
MTNAEIAADLGISTETVKKHVHKLLRSIGVRNRAALAAWWAEVAIQLARQQSWPAKPLVLPA